MISSLSLPKLCMHVYVCFGVKGLRQTCVCGEVESWGCERGVGGGGEQLSVKPNKSFGLSRFACGGAKKGPVICWMTHSDPTPPTPPDPSLHPPPHLICMCMACPARCTIGGLGAPVSSSGPNTEAIVWACRCLGSHAAPSAASRRWGAGVGGAGRSVIGLSAPVWAGPRGLLLLLNIIWCPASCCRRYYLAARTH